MENKAGFWHRGGRRIEADDMFYRHEECLIFSLRLSCQLVRLWMVNGSRENVDLVLQTVAASRAHHLFFTISPLFSPAASETLPVTHFLSHSGLVPVYFSCLNSKDSYLFCRKPNRKKWETPGLQIWAQSGICPIRCSSTGLLWGTLEEIRQIISDTFPKEAVALPW